MCAGGAPERQRRFGVDDGDRLTTGGAAEPGVLRFLGHAACIGRRVGNLLTVPIWPA